MRKVLRLAVAAGLTVAAIASSAAADPASQRPLLQCDTNTVTCDGLLVQGPQRYVPHEIGKPVDLHYLFGPYIVPPGQDSNRITVDIPAETGFIVAVAPDLVDATTGKIPTQQEAHIHHAHWFRITNDPQYDYYDSVDGNGLSWVFGTGEEKTQGRLDDRAKLEPENTDAIATNDFTYGIPIDGSTPQAMIYMVHNKLASVGNYFVVLDVTFIPGTRDQIKAATGKDVHPLYEQLWGQTKDVTDNSTGIGARWQVLFPGTAIAMGSHLHPGGKVVVVSNIGKNVQTTLTDSHGNAVKVTHPLCYSVSLDANDHVVQTGVDPDGDGFAGVALLDSYKYDRNMSVWPYSENYEMGATKFGWRAPLHLGDILEQQGVYALDDQTPATPFNINSADARFHNWYQAMSYTGVYYDRLQNPGPAPTSCTTAAFAPHLLGDDTFDVQGLSPSWTPAPGESPADFASRVDELRQMFNHFLAPGDTNPLHAAIQGMENHPWKVREPLCRQPGLVVDPSITEDCGPTSLVTTPGPVVTQIHVAGFTYIPGDLGTSVGPPIVPKIRQGSTVEFVNDDAALNVRHTFTSCAWPCKGTYVSNFPLPNGGPGAFDTGRLGNVDPIDGGLFNDGQDLPGFLTGQQQSDTVPIYTMTVSLPVGMYSYFCRIHPSMRGAFEVIAPNA
ncbi:MAG: hypothetical protein ABR552_07475 [Actinomycetota bacterium]